MRNTLSELSVLAKPILQRYRSRPGMGVINCSRLSPLMNNHITCVTIMLSDLVQPKTCNIENRKKGRNLQARPQTGGSDFYQLHAGRWQQKPIQKQESGVLSRKGSRHVLANPLPCFRHFNMWLEFRDCSPVGARCQSTRKYHVHISPHGLFREARKHLVNNLTRQTYSSFSLRNIFTIDENSLDQKQVLEEKRASEINGNQFIEEKSTHQLNSHSSQVDTSVEEKVTVCNTMTDRESVTSQSSETSHVTGSGPPSSGSDYNHQIYAEHYFNLFSHLGGQQQTVLTSSSGHSQQAEEYAEVYRRLMATTHQDGQRNDSGGSLTHVDAEGKAAMVDVGSKSPTMREARAEGKIELGPVASRLVKENKMKKGDVLAVAQVAGIMAAKHTASLIPLCHNINLTKVDVFCRLNEDTHSVDISSCVRTLGVTGVEMEALMAVSVTALTVYDMCKAVTHDMVISGVRLVSKSGGKRDFKC